MAENNALTEAAADLDGSYLKVLLTLSIRRAQSEEPRRAGFWHALAVVLADEQERRQAANRLRSESAGPVDPADSADLRALLDELRYEMVTVEAELRESAGDLDIVDPVDVAPA